MIAERSIVGMLLYRHELYRVVSRADNARQHVLTEFIPTGDATEFRRHPDVGFINHRRCLHHGNLVLPDKLGFLPNLRGKQPGL